MPIEDVKKVVKNAGAHIIGVGLGGWGEPMLHPDFLEILKFLESKGVLISFDTNGLLLKEYANDLVNIKTLYHIGISFDFLPESFKDAHSLIDALEGLQALVEAKKRKGKKYPLVRVTVTLMKLNVHMLPELVKLVSEYGGTWLDCHEAIVFDANKLNSPFALPSKEELTYYFNKAKEIGAKLGVRVTYNRRYTEPNVHAKFADVCSVPWTSVFIDFRGYVHPCCFYLYLSFGNLRERELKQIYKGSDYRNFRISLLTGNEQFCKNCLSGTICKNWESIKRHTITST